MALMLVLLVSGCRTAEPQTPEETGESREFNALPWDKIASANYEKLGNFASLLPKLQSAHDARIAKDPEFAYVMQDIADYKEEKDKKSVSLDRKSVV